MTKKSNFLSADVSGASLKISRQKVAFFVIQNYALLSYLERPLVEIVLVEDQPTQISMMALACNYQD